MAGCPLETGAKLLDEARKSLDRVLALHNIHDYRAKKTTPKPLAIDNKSHSEQAEMENLMSDALKSAKTMANDLAREAKDFDSGARDRGDHEPPRRRGEGRGAPVGL